MSEYWFQLESNDLDAHTRDYTVHRCPECSATPTGFRSDNDALICPSCENSFSKSAFENEDEVQACNCWSCGSEITFTAENRSMSSTYGVVENFFSCVECDSIVSVKIEDEFYSPKYLISEDFIASNDTTQIDDRLTIMTSNWRAESKIATFMLSKAARNLDFDKKESNNMSSFRPEDMEGLLALIDGTPAGYLAYNRKESKDGDVLALRHIFFLPKFRGDGYGVKLFQYWVENMAKDVNEVFSIEKPNHIMREILIKTGHAHEEENKIVGEDCFFL